MHCVTLLTVAGYLSYKHYKGAAGASTLKKLGQASSPQQPLNAGLPNLQQEQYNTTANPESGYTGFAPQASESLNAAQPYSGMTTAQANFTGHSGSYSTGNASQVHQGNPASMGPSDSNPMTYQSMLDSLHSSGNAAGTISAYTPVHYPNIGGEGAAGQHPNTAHGAPPPAGGIQSGVATGWSLCLLLIETGNCRGRHCIRV